MCFIKENIYLGLCRSANFLLYCVILEKVRISNF